MNSSDWFRIAAGSWLAGKFVSKKPKYKKQTKKERLADVRRHFTQWDYIAFDVTPQEYVEAFKGEKFLPSDFPITLYDIGKNKEYADWYPAGHDHPPGRMVHVNQPKGVPIPWCMEYTKRVIVCYYSREKEKWLLQPHIMKQFYSPDVPVEATLNFFCGMDDYVINTPLDKLDAKLFSAESIKNRHPTEVAAWVAKNEEKARIAEKERQRIRRWYIIRSIPKWTFGTIVGLISLAFVILTVIYYGGMFVVVILSLMNKI